MDINYRFNPTITLRSFNTIVDVSPFPLSIIYPPEGKELEELRSQQRWQTMEAPLKVPWHIIFKIIPANFICEYIALSETTMTIVDETKRSSVGECCTYLETRKTEE